MGGCRPLEGQALGKEPGARGGGVGMKKIRAMVVDDHSLVRAGLKLVLASLPNVESVIEAANGREALELAESQRLDIVLMDISMSELNGLEATARMVKSHPETRVIILSLHASHEYVVRALRAGASGYLLKDSAPADLERAIAAVMSGGSFLSPAVSAGIIDDIRHGIRSQGDPLALLTPRQREILQLIAEGKSTKQIAFLLKVSVKTIEAHRAQIMERLDISDVAGLVRFAIRTGLTSSDS